jgi:uncharacterized protein
MSTTPRIDAHTHVWPDHIAAQALNGPFPELPRRGDGRIASLQGALRDAGVDMAVCLGVAAEARHVGAVNRYVATLPANVIGFGSTHPSLRPDDVVSDLRANHLRGVKIHPIVQRFGLDDPGLQPILDAMSGEFVVVIHIGDGLPGSGRNCHPEQLQRLVQDFPRLEIVACHLGGYRMYQEAREFAVGLPIYLDTSWPPGLAALDPNQVVQLIQQHGPDRVVFGSDWPMANITSEIEAIEQLGLPAEQNDAILGGNLQRLLGI